MPFRRLTRFWNKIEAWTPKLFCKKDCDHMSGNRHEQSAQQPSDRFRARDLYKVPKPLLEEILEILLQQLQPAWPK